MCCGVCGVYVCVCLCVCVCVCVCVVRMASHNVFVFVRCIDVCKA